MRRHMKRLERLEEAVPEPPAKSELHDLFRFMSWEELNRLSGILRRAEEAVEKFANEQDASDFEKIIYVAHERRLSGWKPEDAWQLGGKDRWGLVFALRVRHPGLYFTNLCNEEFLDPLDVSAEEFNELIALVKRAVSSEEILPFSDVIGRLRVNSRRLDVTTFSDLVFKGIMPHDVAQNGP